MSVKQQLNDTKGQLLLIAEKAIWHHFLMVVVHKTIKILNQYSKGWIKHFLYKQLMPLLS